MNVFISWSGDRSRRLAKALSPLLSGAIPDLRVWMSDALEPGTAWLKELNEKLEESDVGVLCLTPENMDAAWLLFEAGALAKKFSKSRVVPYNLGVPDDLPPPLEQFQSVTADREGTMFLLRSLHGMLKTPLDDTDPLARFDQQWPALENTIAVLRSAKNPGSAREVESERQKARTFCARVAGAWWEHIRNEGIGFFQLQMDHPHNSVQLSGGRFYDQHSIFTAYFNSAVSRIDDQGGKKGIVYLRQCHNPDRDADNWFHGYGTMWFEGSAESLDSGHGTFYDMRSNDPKQAVANQVRLWRAKDENEAIRIMDKGTPAEQKALVKQVIDALEV